MSSRRVLKAAQAIREVVSMAIIRDLKDPRIKDVTVTMVEVTADMRQAKVNVSIMGDKAKQKLCLHGLQNSAGFLQQKIGKRIDTRYTPRIEFVLDKGQMNALTVTRILEEVLPKEREAAAASNTVERAEECTEESLETAPPQAAEEADQKAEDAQDSSETSR